MIDRQVGVAVRDADWTPLSLKCDGQVARILEERLNQKRSYEAEKTKLKKPIAKATTGS